MFFGFLVFYIEFYFLFISSLNYFLMVFFMRSGVFWGRGLVLFAYLFCTVFGSGSGVGLFLRLRCGSWFGVYIFLVFVVAFLLFRGKWRILSRFVGERSVFVIRFKFLSDVFCVLLSMSCVWNISCLFFRLF